MATAEKEIEYLRAVEERLDAICQALERFDDMPNWDPGRSNAEIRVREVALRIQRIRDAAVSKQTDLRAGMESLVDALLDSGDAPVMDVVSTAQREAILHAVDALSNRLYFGGTRFKRLLPYYEEEETEEA